VPQSNEGSQGKRSGKKRKLWESETEMEVMRFVGIDEKEAE
jgi:hypothetical protein